MSKNDEALAKKLAEPIKPSGERSKEKGNTHPVKAADREDSLSGNTATADHLAALYTQRGLLDEQIKEAEQGKKDLEESELYKRDLKVLAMSKSGRLPGQNVGEIATVQEEDRAKSELKSLEKVEDKIKKEEPVLTPSKK